MFERPLLVPGRALPPATYLFRVGPSIGGQALVDIYDSGTKRLLVTCLAVETDLAESDSTSLAVYPRTAPQAVRGWFHPGRRAGYEFVYPSSQGWRIFEQSGTTVPFTATKTFDHDLVGAYVVRRLGVSTREAAPVGTSGPMTGEPDAQNHLVAAQRLVAARLTQGAPEDVARWRVFEDHLIAAARDYTERQRVSPRLEAVSRMIEDTLARPGREDRLTIVALERLHAHLTAFRRAARMF